MQERFVRTEMIIGEPALKKLAQSHVAVFGVGGVGGYVVEALARCDIGKLDLIDNDTVSISNINRQIIALNSTIGKYKVDVMKDRVLDINPECEVTTYNKFFTPENSSEFDFSKYDYVVDAIDTVTSKIELVIKSQELNIPIISSMGAGNKLHPEMFEISDIYKTSVCPLAKVMRTELKKRRIKHLKVVYSKEPPIKPEQNEENKRKRLPGSISFVPSTVGLIIAGEVVRDLME